MEQRVRRNVSSLECGRMRRYKELAYIAQVGYKHQYGEEEGVQKI